MLDELEKLLRLIASHDSLGHARISFDSQSSPEFYVYSDEGDYGWGETLAAAIAKAKETYVEIHT